MQKPHGGLPNNSPDSKTLCSMFYGPFRNHYYILIHDYLLVFNRSPVKMLDLKILDNQGSTRVPSSLVLKITKEPKNRAHMYRILHSGNFEAWNLPIISTERAKVASQLKRTEVIYRDILLLHKLPNLRVVSITFVYKITSLHL